MHKQNKTARPRGTDSGEEHAMEIKITGEPKEIAALVLEIQGRREEESVPLNFVSDIVKKTDDLR